MSLTVACVFVQGPYPYTAEYVVRLERMVRKHLSVPYRFVCLTDRPQLLKGFDCIRIDSTLGSPESDGYWTKLRLFDPAVGLSGRVLFLDLDVLVVAPLDPIVDIPSRLALIDDAASRDKRGPIGVDRYGREVLRNVNSSVIVFDADFHPNHRLFTDWTPAVSERLSGDQDWIGDQSRFGVSAMTEQWFPRISQVRPPWPEAAKVVLCKKPKNHEAVEQWPELREWWG